MIWCDRFVREMMFNWRRFVRFFDLEFWKGLILMMLVLFMSILNVMLVVLICLSKCLGFVGWVRLDIIMVMFILCWVWIFLVILLSFDLWCVVMIKLCFVCLNLCVSFSLMLVDVFVIRVVWNLFFCVIVLLFKNWVFI